MAISKASYPEFTFDSNTHQRLQPRTVQASACHLRIMSKQQLDPKDASVTSGFLQLFGKLNIVRSQLPIT